jgi:hypothetical protein
MNEIKAEDYNFANEYFTLNTDKFPYIYVKFEAKQPTDEEFEEYIEYAGKLLLQNQPYAIILNLSKAGYLKAKYRIKVGNFFKKNQTHISKFCRGTAHITDSAIQKFLLQAIFAVQKPPYEYIVVKEEERAYQWLEEQLAK